MTAQIFEMQLEHVVIDDRVRQMPSEPRRLEDLHPAYHPDPPWLVKLVSAQAGGGRLREAELDVIAVILQSRSQLRRRPGYRGPAIAVLRRSPARLMFDTREEARPAQRPGRERLARSSAAPRAGTGLGYRGLALPP